MNTRRSEAGNLSMIDPFLMHQESDSTAKNYTSCTPSRKASNQASEQVNHGKAYRRSGNLAKARRCFESAIRAAPNQALAWFNLAEIDIAEGHLERAIERYRTTIRIDPHMLAAHNNLGNALKRAKRYDEAIAAYQNALTLNPNLAQGYYNLGNTYRLIEDHLCAIAQFAKALKLDPTYSEAWNNLALTCQSMGDWDRALCYFNRALDINTEFASARWNRSVVHFLKNDWLNGWQDFEARFTIPQWSTIYPHRIDGLRWNGDPIPEGTVLVHDEQGLGDTLQFMRLLPWVKSRCGRLVFETRPEIIHLLETHAHLGIDEMLARSPSRPPAVPYDRHISLISIPGLFGLTPDHKPPWKPYIHSTREKIIHWRTRLPAGKLRVGLVWAGRPEHTNDENRSCGLKNLSPLFMFRDIQFVGLQKGDAASQIDAFHEANFCNLGPELETFGDTAAVLAQLDLLISVDTSVAHLAGAMGMPVWMLIPHIPDWRWGLTGKHTFWYPTMTLYRQPRARDWASVVSEILQALHSL